MQARYTLYIISALVCLGLSFSLPVHARNMPDELKLSTIVIDAGHGGKDAGCVSADRKTLEKHVNLAVAKQLGSKISKAYPDVKVVYTRTKDEYLTLNRRADIANASNADLFISIHVNSVRSSQPRGFSVHILGQSRDKDTDLFSYNMEVCKRENSVILLEEDYTTKYQGFDPNDPESYIFFNLMQNAFYEQSITFAASVHEEMKKGPIYTDRGLWQDPFYVLWKTKMPAALVELGFMSNPKDLAILRSESGQEQLATRLFDAFVNFKTKYDQSLDVPVVETEAAKQAELAKQEEAKKQAELAKQDELAKQEEIRKQEEVKKQVEPTEPEDIKTKIEESLKQTEAQQTEIKPEITKEETKPTANKPEAKSTKLYGTQVMSLERLLDKNHKEFRGYTATIVKVGKLYKYIIGVSADPREANRLNKEVKKLFPGAFMVSVSEGKVDIYRP